ncbi:MAG: anaerobic sulfatase maturase [Clostridia bacterium]|nr:anaerobic sulfatase maturase [Clostridia bacterium]
MNLSYIREEYALPPISLLIKPASGACQYRCKYCFYADVMNNRSVPNYGSMTFETLESLVKRAMLYAEGSVAFAFQGGEPTLAGLDFYRELIRLEKKHNRGLQVFNSIQTNGGLIDDEWAEFLAENRFLVGLSLDGCKNLHDQYRKDAQGNGTYDRTLETAERFQRHGAEFNILCVVNDDVASHPTETYEAIRRFKYLQFIPCIDDFDLKERLFSPSPENYGRFLIETFRLYLRDIQNGEYVSVRAFDNYVQMLKGRRPESCSMTGRCTCYFVIEGNGDVYPCDFYVLDKWKLGNIAFDDFRTMLKSKKAQEFVSTSVYMHPDCRVCRHYSLCRGGCRRDREPFDEMNRPGKSRYCESYRMFFEACGEDLRNLARLIR